MKIAFVLTQDLESPSGLGRYLPFARELARLGHQIHVLALHPNYNALRSRQLEFDGINVFYAAPMHVKKQGNRKTYYSNLQIVFVALRATWSLFLGILKVSPDLIYLGKPHPMNGIAGYLASKLLGKLLYLDCDDDEAGSNVYQASWQRRVVVFFERWLPERAALISSNTFHTLERIRANVGEKKRIMYLPNGVDRDRFADTKELSANVLREKLGYKNEKIILYLGSMGLVHHQVDILIEAFRMMNVDYPQVRLLLVGGGEDYDKLLSDVLRLGLSEKIKFTGRVAPSEVKDYYRLALVSVDPISDNPAARGRAPLKMFESWAAGVPFVTADVGDRKILAGDPPAALIVQPADAAHFEQGIRQILDDPELAENLRKRGLERVEAFYWDRIVSRIDWL